MNFQGSYVALITPFSENGIDKEALSAMIEYQISHGTDGIVVLGTTGEPATMTAAEKAEVMRIARDTVRGRVPLIVGSGCNSTLTAAENSRIAEAQGADALLVVTPYYNKCTQKGIIEHYRAIKKAVSLPVIAYNVPGRTGVNILPSTSEILAKDGLIDAIKEASGNMSQVIDTLRRVKGLIPLLSGDDGLVAPIMCMGGKGVISVAANIVPAEMHELCELAAKGDYEKARDLQLRLTPLVDALFCEVNPIPVKTAASIMGFCGEILRLPLTNMESPNRDRLVAEMRTFGLI